MSSRGPSCKNDRDYKIISNLHLPPELPFRVQHIDKPMQTKAKTSLGLWLEHMGALLGALGYTHEGLIMGAMLELVNRFPPEVRRRLLTGIIEGRGLSVTIDKDAVVIEHPKRFDALGDQGETKTPSGLWLPGGIKS
jgi:hypothetical protein